MKTLLMHIFVNHWQRKLIALLIAAVIWALVNHSITVTRTVTNIPVRVLNIPEDKTVEGMSPDGLLNRRVALTLTGARGTLQRITPQDIEVVTDAAGKGEQWTIEVSKRNLRSLTPDIDLATGVASVAPVDLTVQLSPIVTALVPVTITAPVGEPPAGYSYLDVWPQRLTQRVSGPEKQVEELKSKGLKLTFDLSQISEEELRELTQQEGGQRDEIRFFVPENWQQVSIPFRKGETEELNDPEASFLHITFLKQQLVPLGLPLPVNVFYPLESSQRLNPEETPLRAGELLEKVNGVMVLREPVLVGNVSELFLDTVQGNARLTVVASEESGPLPWSVGLVNPRRLEDAYVETLMAGLPAEESALRKLREEYLRTRFRNYASEFAVYSEDNQPLRLTPELISGGITVREEE